MAVAESWAGSADPSLVRHFILQLLESVAPPFSQVAGGVIPAAEGGGLLRMRC